MPLPNHVLWTANPHFRRRRTILNRQQQIFYRSARRNIHLDIQAMKLQGNPMDQQICRYKQSISTLIGAIMEIGRQTSRTDRPHLFVALGVLQCLYHFLFQKIPNF